MALAVYKPLGILRPPLIAPTIIITLLIRAIWISNFAEIIIVMTNGGPANSTQIVATYIYDTAYQKMDFGYCLSHIDRASQSVDDLRSYSWSNSSKNDNIFLGKGINA